MDVENQAINLAFKVGEIALRNGATSIFSKIKSTKASNEDKKTISVLEEIINELLEDKNQLISITKSYEEEFVMQKISDKNINYITNEFTPVIKEFISKASDKNDSDSLKEIDEMMDSLKPILSVETFTVLQLIGFNFNKAIGEPLTNLLRKSIESKEIITEKENYEINKLQLESQIALQKIVSDEDSFNRYKELTQM